MKTEMKSNITSLKAGTTSELSESEAVHLAQEGDARGFERLYHLRSGRVYSLCLQKVEDPVEAEDLTHDAFLQTFRNIHPFGGEWCPSPWLRRLTVNTVLMSFRKKKHPQISNICFCQK